MNPIQIIPRRLRFSDPLRATAARISYVVIFVLHLSISFSLLVLTFFAIPRTVPVALFFAVSFLTGLVFLMFSSVRSIWRTMVVGVASIGLFVSVTRFFPFFLVRGAADASFVLLFQFDIFALAALPFAYGAPIEFITLPVSVVCIPLLYSRIQNEPSWFVFVSIAICSLFAALYHQYIRARTEHVRAVDALEESKRLSSKLATATAKLMDQQQREMLSGLSAGLVHEINNPINHIAGNLVFLERDIALLARSARSGERDAESTGIAEAERRANDVVRSTRNGVDAISLVVARLRQLFKGAGAAPRVVYLKELIDTVVSALYDPRKRSIVVDNGIPDRVTIRCHPEDMYTIAVNVLRNALDAVSEGGRIGIAATETEDTIELSITDNGCGIPQESMQWIFDPFFSTKSEANGLGIGLALTQALVRNMRGAIRIDSEEKKYTKVTIRIPKDR